MRNEDNSEIKNYKGYTIILDCKTGIFKAEDEEDRCITSAPNLKEIQSMIDGIVSRGFKRVPVYKFENEELEKSEVTSVNRQGKCFWLSAESGRAKYRSARVLLKDNEKNEPIIKEMQELLIQKGEIEKKLESLYESGERLTWNDLGLEDKV